MISARQPRGERFPLTWIFLNTERTVGSPAGSPDPQAARLVPGHREAIRTESAMQALPPRPAVPPAHPAMFATLSSSQVTTVANPWLVRRRHMF